MGDRKDSPLLMCRECKTSWIFPYPDKKAIAQVAQDHTDATGHISFKVF